jgi:hypothetical protein
MPFPAFLANADAMQENNSKMIQTQLDRSARLSKPSRTASNEKSNRGIVTGCLSYTSVMWYSGDPRL